MSTITSSGTLTYSSGSFSYTGTFSSGNANTWPITISAGVKVTFGSNLTLTDINQYFIIGGTGVTIDGAGYQVDFSGISTSLSSYSGFIGGGSTAYSSTIQNIGCINSGTNQIIQYISRGNFGATSSISNCYVISNGNISNGIAGQFNSTAISNCYVICGGNITSGGISGYRNSGSISNCYVICGGNISDNASGIAGANNSATISNCYVICGGIIDTSGGGIAAIGNSATGTISYCYVICGGNIYGGGIAGSSNSGQISNCYVSCSNASSSNFVGSGTQPTSCAFDTVAKWKLTGSTYLTSSAWTNTDSTNNTPWVLSAFNTAIASSTTTSTASGSILLNTYGQSFLNGTVYSGQQTATFNYYYGSNITYSALSTGTTYTLGLYAYDLLSNLTAIAFTFTNDSAIKTAFNYTGSTAEDIVPYTYSVTNNVSLTYSASVDCFLEGTKILTDKGYVNIEKLSKEHLVITLEGKKRIYKIGKCTMDNLAMKEKIKDQLYVYSSSDYQQITQGDLVITGGHSILVDSFENEQQEEDTKQILGEIFLTKNKLRLPVCLDKRSRVYEEKGEKTIYHIALEHIHYDCNYGIYANGLLVESCSQNYIDNKSDNLVCIDI